MKIKKKKLYKSHGTGFQYVNKLRKIGANVIIEDNVRIFHPENINIGSNVYIGHNSILKGYYNGIMSIGRDTWIGQNCFFHSAGNLEIGMSVGIGPSVQIITSYHINKNLNQPVLSNSLKFKKVTIKSGSDIGMNSVILPGVTIGEGAIIGAGSVVTKSIDPYVIAIGSPAKQIKDRKL